MRDAIFGEKAVDEKEVDPYKKLELIDEKEEEEVSNHLSLE